MTHHSHLHAQPSAPLTSDPLRILVLDDSEFDRMKIKRLFSQADNSIEVTCCADLAQFEEALEKGMIDVCLVDHELTGSTGFEALELLNNRAASSALPVVMISGREDTSTVVRSMKAGCVDYLGKGSLTAERLFNSVQNAIAATFSDPKMQDEVRVATGRVLDGITSGCIKELKPRLSRMYKQIAFIRACETKGLLPAPEALDDIEEQCLTIWRFFDEVSSYSENLATTRH